MLTSIRTALAGRYVLERELGRGASAVVYAARDLKHGRRVALKVIEADVVSTLGTRRFLQEVRTTARLNHPHILPLFDSGDADGFIYYTMPLVQGESLRQRMEQRGPMTPDAVLPVVSQMAGALFYAHSAGVVHRDIKPENILIDEQEHVWIADFGLARALAGAVDQRLTGTAMAVGSPHYMSPEQAAGESDVDGRSDIYSLGCIVFEMLCGEPPFTAGSVASLLARHLSEPAPTIRDRCPDLPERVDRALMRAMAKDRSHRFADARDFVAAMSGAHAVGADVPPAAARPRRSSQHTRWPLIGGLFTASVLVAVATIRPEAFTGWPLRGADLDSSTFLILPAQLPGSVVDEHLREALVRWRDVTVVERAAIDRALQRAGNGSLQNDWPGVARTLDAGRVIRTRVTPLVGDSLRVDASLLDANRDGEELATHSIRISRTDERPQQAYMQLTNALLFPGWRDDGVAPGTDSRAAQRSYLAGLEAIREWDLERADSLFKAATREDPAFSRAHAWRAQAIFWADGSDTEARRAAEQALAGAGESSSREQELAAALIDLTSQAYPEACRRYEFLLGLNPRDYAATRGLADCHGRDNLVVSDPGSPTGWSFRGSGHRALIYHQRAFELLPASHRAFRAARFLQLRTRIFYTNLSQQRRGVNAAGEAFLASPSWSDTLAFHPARREAVWQGQGRPSEAGIATVVQLRRIFFDVTAGWVSAYPESPDALEAHAIAMELQGDTRALAMLDRARLYATDPEHRVNLSVSEFWLQFKHAVPQQPRDLSTARLLADTILAYDGPMAQATLGRLAAVAALTGRAHLAAQLARRAVVPGAKPLLVAENGAVLLAYAAVAGPIDSIARYEQLVETAISNLVRPEDAATVRQEMLGRPATLTLSGHRMSIIDSPDAIHDYLIAAVSAHHRGEQDSVRTILARMAERRSAYRPADLKVEALLPEAWLLLKMRDADAALRWLGPTLDEIRYMEPGVLEDVASAGSLARALLLRAEIARSVRDTTGMHQWATALVELWANADPELTPIVNRARYLAASPSGN
jgi:eukaryotic-like serine/threonine-protein kinase